MSSAVTNKKRAADSPPKKGNEEASKQDGEQSKKDAFEIMMNATRSQSKRIKAKPLPEGRIETTPQPANALDKLMITARHTPFAFCPNCSDQDILGYLNRHPEWRFLISELIDEEKVREEKEEEQADMFFEDIVEEDHDELREKVNDLDKFIPHYPSPANIQDHQIWQVENLRTSRQSQLVDKTRRRNRELPLPPVCPNKDAVLIAVHVHFEISHREQRHEPWVLRINTVRIYPKYDICGWTLIYDDHVEIRSGITDDWRSNGRGGSKVTVKLKLQTNEHIQAIGTQTHKGPLQEGAILAGDKIGFFTTKKRWLIADNGREKNDGWRICRWHAPKGEVFTFFEYDPKCHNGSFECDDPQYCLSGEFRNLCNAKTTPLDDLKCRSTVPSLSMLCEEKLQDYLKKKSSDASKAFHAKLENHHHDDEVHLRCELVFQYQSELHYGPETETIRSLVRLQRVANERFETKFNKLLYKAKREQQRAIQESQSIVEETCKVPHRQEQDRIYADHVAFLETKARLSAEEDDTIDTIGYSKTPCIFPLCREVFRPKNLPKSKRCMSDDCGTAFVMCGCVIQTCRYCSKPFCPWHIQDHRFCLFEYTRGSPLLPACDRPVCEDSSAT